MSDVQKEVAEKYKYLFKGYHFNFEGFKSETKEGFIQLVEDLGGKVSKDASYVFVRKRYFERKENNMRENLYDIDYIMDAVDREDASNLPSYRFIPSCNDEPMCYAARYFYKTDSCHKCYYEKAFCKDCETNQESQNGTSKENSQSITATDSNTESKGKTTNISKKKIDKDSSNPSKRYISSESEQNSADEEQNVTMLRSKSPAKKKVKKSSSVPNNNDVRKSPETHVWSKTKDREDDYISWFSKEEGGQKVRKMFEGVHSHVKTGMVDSQNSNPNNSDLAEGPSIGKPIMSPSSVTRNVNKEADEESGSDDKSTGSLKPNWWLQPEQKIPADEKCNDIFCTFEPGPHRAHYQPNKFLSFYEKMIIMKYLIVNDSIQKAKTNSIYDTMISEGYLRHRTAETLRNNFRRTIMFELHKYKLNGELLKQFTSLMDSANRRKPKTAKKKTRVTYTLKI